MRLCTARKRWFFRRRKAVSSLARPAVYSLFGQWPRLRSYEVEVLRNDLIGEVHATHLKFYHDPSLDAEAVIPHVPSSKPAMEAQRLIRLFESVDSLIVRVRYWGRPTAEDTDEPLQKVYKDVQDQIKKLSSRKNTLRDLSKKVRLDTNLQAQNGWKTKKDALIWSPVALSSLFITLALTPTEAGITALPGHPCDHP